MAAKYENKTEPKARKKNLDNMVDTMNKRAVAEDTAPVSDETKQKIVQQYRDRAEASSSRKYGADRQTIAEGSINPNIDTVYRVGADDPYGYYSQSQLNNAMSGPDANAIYAATHDQQQIADYNEPYWQDYLTTLTDMGRKQNYAQQRPDIPLYQNGAYVTGADAFVGRNGRVLNPGQGSSLGIPTWMLAPYGIHGEGLNGGPGDITQQQVATPWNLGENPVSNNAVGMTDERLRGVVNSITNNALNAREDTNLRPSMIYGYGDAPLDYNRYEFYDEYPEYAPENYLSLSDYLKAWNLGNWVSDSGIADTPADQDALSRAFLLMQNANEYDRQRNLEQMTQQYRDRDLYGDALMELMAQRQNTQNNRSLLNEALQQIRDQEILENRPSPRRRNITGSAVW